MHEHKALFADTISDIEPRYLKCSHKEIVSILPTANSADIFHQISFILIP
jgi:hypothetical protein